MVEDDLRAQIVIQAEKIPHFQTHPEELEVWLEDAVQAAKENLKLMVALRRHG